MKKFGNINKLPYICNVKFKTYITMKNFIKINLAESTESQIREFADKYDLIYDVLLSNKNHSKLCMAYISDNGMIAYTLTSDPSRIIYTQVMDSLLNSIPEYKEEVKPLSDVNEILEKITKCGFDSLLEEEVAILEKIK